MNGVTRQAVGAKTALCSRDMSCDSIQLRKRKGFMGRLRTVAGGRRAAGDGGTAVGIPGE